MLDVLKFKSSLFGGVLDNGEDQIFMGESRFKKFMHAVEEMTTDETRQPDLFEETEIHIEQKETAKPEQTAAKLFSTAAEVFSSLAQTFAGQQTSIEKDQTGKSYLKIPIENQEAMTKGLTALQGFLETIQKK